MATVIEVLVQVQLGLNWQCFCLQAAVVCQQLGYNGVINFTLASTFGPVPSFYAFDNVNCSGKETSLNDCPHLNEDDCTSFEGAGVVCNTESSECEYYNRMQVVNLSISNMMFFNLILYVFSKL
jgi:hypothetical protein